MAKIHRPEGNDDAARRLVPDDGIAGTASIVGALLSLSTTFARYGDAARIIDRMEGAPPAALREALSLMRLSADSLLEDVNRACNDADLAALNVISLGIGEGGVPGLDKGVGNGR